MSSRIVSVLFVLLGAALWIVISLLAGVQEAWDHSSYWRFGYALLALFSAAGGYWLPRKPWRWPLFLVLGQFLTMFVQNPTANLLPLGIVFLGIVSVPLLVPAYLGALIKNRRAKGAETG